MGLEGRGKWTEVSEGVGVTPEDCVGEDSEQRSHGGLSPLGSWEWLGQDGEQGQASQRACSWALQIQGLGEASFILTAFIECLLYAKLIPLR